MVEAKPADQMERMLLAQLRMVDRDRYLSVLLSPADKRFALAALYSFNAELARVRSLVSEPLPGEMRLQYWRDLVEGEGHGDTAANPVASALLDVIGRYQLPRTPFSNMIEARIFDVYDDPMGPSSDFEGYAGETASALIQLASLIVDAERAPAHAESAGHAGVAQAAAGVILLLPEHRARGQVYIPSDILAATGLDREAFLDGRDSARTGNAIRAFAAFALQHLDRFTRRGPVASSLVPAYLPVAISRRILLRAETLGEGVFGGDVQPSQWRRQLMMMRSLLFRKF